MSVSTPKSTISPVLEIPSPNIISKVATLNGGANLFFNYFYFDWISYNIAILIFYGGPGFNIQSDGCVELQCISTGGGFRVWNMTPIFFLIGL